MTVVEPAGCSQCGATLDVADGKTPTVTFVGSSGRPNERILTIEGKEIHRCEFRADTRPTSTRDWGARV